VISIVDSIKSNRPGYKESALRRVVGVSSSPLGDLFHSPHRTCSGGFGGKSFHLLERARPYIIDFAATESSKDRTGADEAARRKFRAVFMLVGLADGQSAEVAAMTTRTFCSTRSTPARIPSVLAVAPS
jgi:hypothetical protein